MLTLEAYTRLCPVLFGISQHSLPGHINFTNTYYGADRPQTHRVLYVNGVGLAKDYYNTVYTVIL